MLVKGVGFASGHSSSIGGFVTRHLQNKQKREAIILMIILKAESLSGSVQERAGDLF